MSSHMYWETVANNLHRVRYQVQYANVLDFSRETKKLTDILKQYSLGENSMFV